MGGGEHVPADARRLRLCCRVRRRAQVPREPALSRCADLDEPDPLVPRRARARLAAPLLGRFYARASADFTLSGLSGAWRSRTPVALKNAFATAAGMTRIVGSPAPLGAISGGSISTISIALGAFCLSELGVP